MNYNILFRVILYLVIIFTIINGWWFLSLPLLIFGMWMYSFRLEIIISGVIYDALFGMVPFMGIWGYVGTITAVLILIVLAVLKKVIR